MNSIKISFYEKPVPGETLYTFKTEDTMKVGQIVWVETHKGLDRGRVVSIDEQYDEAAEARYGELKPAYVDKPEPKTTRTHL